MRNGLGAVVSPVRIRIGECRGNLRRADESDLFESAKTLLGTRQALFQTSPSPFECNEIDSERQSVRQDLVDADRSSPTFDFTHESGAKAKHFGNLFLRIPKRFPSFSQQRSEGSALHNPCSARHDLVATDCHHCSILTYRCRNSDLKYYHTNT